MVTLGMGAQQVNPELTTQCTNQEITLHWLLKCTNQVTPTANNLLVLMITHWSVIYASLEMVILPLTHDDDTTGSGEHKFKANQAGQQGNNAHVALQVANSTQ